MSSFRILRVTEKFSELSMLVQLVASSGVKIDMISIICGTFVFIRRFSQNYEKRLLPSSCPVSPPDRMEQLDFHWKDFEEIYYLGISRKSGKNIWF